MCQLKTYLNIIINFICPPTSQENVEGLPFSAALKRLPQPAFKDAKILLLD